MLKFAEISLETFRSQIKKFETFATDPQWLWTLRYDIMLNPALGDDFSHYIDEIQSANLSCEKLEKIMEEIREKSIKIAEEAEKEEDITKKWFLYRHAYAYYGFLEVIIEGSNLTTQILDMFREKYKESYLDILKKVDNINPSVLTNFSSTTGEFLGKEIDLYLLMKKWQDSQHLYHNNELIGKHNQAKQEFEKYVHDKCPYLSEIRGRDLLGIYLLDRLPIINMDQIHKFFDLGITDKLANIVGGKNLGLAKLSYSGVEIPAAYAVPVNSVLNKLYIEYLDELEEGKYSVRSSATVEDNKSQSFAGLFVTELNIDKNDVSTSVENVHNSVYSDRVMKYCEKFKTKKPFMSVVVQKFKEPEYSGVWVGSSLESGHLEWTYGNGEKLVSGKVVPNYENWNEKVANPFSIENIVVGEKCIELQQQLGTISDFEWCIVDGQLLFVQFRPVTVTFNTKKQTKAKEESEMIGIPASAGVAIGKPNYLEDVDGISTFNKDEILLADFTDPDWVPAMINSKAIVTAEGGFLSHSAIISRELGIPCVTGLGYDNIEKLSTMEEIIVDGNTGVVKEAKVLGRKLKN